ncbi:MAG: DUF1638 domain-containing protein [Candidatus Brocadiia bacterium]
MSAEHSFTGQAVVACGTLRGELEALQDDGFLDAEALLFTAPGLHERPRELEAQLVKQLARARDEADETIVVYGARCYVDYSDPTRAVDALIKEQGPGSVRVAASNCVDMLADADRREQIADGDSIYLLTPGWVRYWRHIFRDWDAGKANETFPQNDRVVVLDGLGFFQRRAAERPEEILAFSDWMKIPIVAETVSLDRLRRLLLEAGQQVA